jgi:ABC-type transport system involved in cytochrome c biogenesis permease component
MEEKYGLLLSVILMIFIMWVISFVATAIDNATSGFINEFSIGIIFTIIVLVIFFSNYKEDS